MALGAPDLRITRSVRNGRLCFSRNGRQSKELWIADAGSLGPEAHPTQGRSRDDIRPHAREGRAKTDAATGATPPSAGLSGKR